MNNKTLNNISQLIDELETIKSQVEEYMGEEESKFNNLPENLQGSDAAQRMQASSSGLQEAMSSIEEAVNSLSNIY
jgi:division protein CdvB (Snf7/Vps24/ESCRT-III family)